MIRLTKCCILVISNLYNLLLFNCDVDQTVKMILVHFMFVLDGFCMGFLYTIVLLSGRVLPRPSISKCDGYIEPAVLNLSFLPPLPKIYQRLFYKFGSFLLYCWSVFWYPVSFSPSTKAVSTLLITNRDLNLPHHKIFKVPRSMLEQRVILDTFPLHRDVAGLGKNTKVADLMCL